MKLFDDVSGNCKIPLSEMVMRCVPVQVRYVFLEILNLLPWFNFKCLVCLKKGFTLALLMDDHRLCCYCTRFKVSFLALMQVYFKKFTFINTVKMFPD